MSKRIKVSDGSSWPRPAIDSDDEVGIGWKLTYGNPTESDLLEAASIIAAYGYLTIDATAAKRALVVRDIRASIRAERKRND